MAAGAPTGRPATKRGEPRNVTIQLRAPERWRALIDHAASLNDQTRTDFILDATRRQAEAVLLDRRFFELDDAAYRAFVDILDNPPAPNDELRKLMKRKAPWPRS